MNLRPAGDDIFAVVAIAAVVFATMMVYDEYTEVAHARQLAAQTTAQVR